MKRVVLSVAALAAFWGAAGPAAAGPVDVLVGYADGLRGGGFFPLPWEGDPGVVFVGNSPGHAFDAGAIRIDNNGLLPITVNDVSVNLHPATQANIFDLWGSTVLLPGQKLVLTQTTDYNFDTSDFPISDPAHPVLGGPDSPAVTITINGVPTVYLDTGHVLDTQGFDFAAIGNESFAWRGIGTSGTPSGVPEPSTLALVGFGAAGLAGYTWRRRRRTA